MNIFFVKCCLKGTLIRVVASEIIYIEASLNYVQIHQTKGNVLTYLTMGEIQNVLCPKQFLRVHKSFIINIDKLIAIESGSLIMNNQTFVHIGSTYRAELSRILEPLIVQSKRR